MLFLPSPVIPAQVVQYYLFFLFKRCCPSKGRHFEYALRYLNLKWVWTRELFRAPKYWYLPLFFNVGCHSATSLLLLCFAASSCHGLCFEQKATFFAPFPCFASHKVSPEKENSQDVNCTIWGEKHAFLLWVWLSRFCTTFDVFRFKRWKMVKMNAQAIAHPPVCRLAPFRPTVMEL